MRAARNPATLPATAMKNETTIDPDAAIRLAADCGSLVLENGGETYRAEECMTAIALAYGGREPECFAIPTGAMFSMNDEQGRVHSLIVRIKRRATDMGTLARVNALRNAAVSGNLGFQQACQEVQAITAAAPPALAPELLGAACVAAFFCLLFHGDWRGALVSAFLGFCLKASLRIFSGKLLTDFLLNVLGGFQVALLARIALALLPGLSIDSVIIGTLMLLVPGTLIVNAIRDIIAGDLVAGVARSAEALMSAAAISLGTALGIKLASIIPGLGA